MGGVVVGSGYYRRDGDVGHEDGELRAGGVGREHSPLGQVVGEGAERLAEAEGGGSFEEWHCDKIRRSYRCESDSAKAKRSNAPSFELALPSSMVVAVHRPIAVGWCRWRLAT